MERFRRTDCLELKKFHNVGLLLDDEKDPQILSAAQALILGYMYADAIDSISAPMVHAKLGDIISSGSSNQAELMVRYVLKGTCTSRTATNAACGGRCGVRLGSDKL